MSLDSVKAAYFHGVASRSCWRCGTRTTRSLLPKARRHSDAISPLRGLFCWRPATSHLRRTAAKSRTKSETSSFKSRGPRPSLLKRGRYILRTQTSRACERSITDISACRSVSGPGLKPPTFTVFEARRINFQIVVYASSYARRCRLALKPTGKAEGNMAKKARVRTH